MIFQKLNFRNTRIYITGGSSGIGLATALKASSLGAHVLIFARSQEPLDDAVARIKEKRQNSDQRVEAMVLDVSDNDAVESTMRAAVEEFGVPDVLIANAGIGCAGYFEDITYDAFDTVMKINVYGVRNVVAALVPAMKDLGGHIVIMSSMAGLVGVFGYTGYSTSKFALIGFAESLRSELKRQNIAVSVVCPPEVDTHFLETEALSLPPEARLVKDMAGRLSPEKAAEAVVRTIGTRKFFIIPGVMAKASYYLARFAPGWMTRATTDLNVKWSADKTS